MVAEKVHDRCVFDEHGFERRYMARDVVFQHTKVPLSEETLKGLGKVGTESPRCSRSRCPWGRFSFPPNNGVIYGLKSYRLRYGSWMLAASRRIAYHKVRPLSLERSILVVSNLALVLEPRS